MLEGYSREQYQKLLQKTADAAKRVEALTPEQVNESINQENQVYENNFVYSDDDGDDEEIGNQNDYVKRVTEDNSYNSPTPPENPKNVVDFANFAINRGVKALQNNRANFERDADEFDRSIKNNFVKMPKGYGTPLENAICPTISNIAEQTKNDDTNFKIDSVNVINSLTGKIDALAETIQKAFDAKIQYVTAKQADICYEESRTEEDYDNIISEPNTARINGEIIHYNTISKDMSPTERKKMLDYFEKNNTIGAHVDYIRWYITQEILNRFEIERITSIYVSEVGELIINNTDYAPQIALTRKEIFKYLPPDMEADILNRYYANLFLWGNLRLMKNLYSLTFTSMNFVINYVSLDLKIRDEIGVATFFKLNSSLQVLSIGSETLNRDDLNTDKSKKMKEDMSKNKRFSKITGAIKKKGLRDKLFNNIAKPYEITKTIQDTVFSTTKDYFLNRGDRGFLKQAGGVIGLSCLSILAATLNASTNIVHNVTNMISDAVHPLDESSFTSAPEVETDSDVSTE